MTINWVSQKSIRFSGCPSKWNGSNRIALISIDVPGAKGAFPVIIPPSLGGETPARVRLPVSVLGQTAEDAFRGPPVATSMEAPTNPLD